MVQDHLDGVAASVGRRGEIGGTNIDRVYITVMVRVVAVREQAVRKERKKDKFREGKQFIARKSESSSPVAC